MTLTDGEKIIIALLADIHKALKIKDGMDVDRLMSSVYYGHLWSLKWDMPGLLENREADPEVVRETANILDAWQFIETSFAALDDAGKEKVRQANFGRDPVFPGLDANNDPHYGVARHFIEDMGRFEHFKGRYLNSHAQLIHVHLGLARAFEELRGKLGMRHPMHMTADEIAGLFREAYPHQAVA